MKRERLESENAERSVVPPAAPGFGELLRANLRVLAWALVLGLIAYATWRGLRGLFPEVRWLQ